MASLRLYLKRIVVVSLVVSTAPWANAQRHSGDSRVFSSRRLDPILSIDDRQAHTWLYPRLSQLLKMNSTSVEATDPLTGKSVFFAGVEFQELLPSFRAHRLNVYRTGLFRDKLAIDSEGLDLTAPLLIACKEDGRLLREQPFWFVAKRISGAWIVVPNLAYLRVDD